MILSGRVAEARFGNAPVPAAPSNLTAQTSGTRSVTLACGRGRHGAAQYRIEVGSRPVRANLAVFDTGSTQTSFTAVSVPDGTYLRARSRDRRRGERSVDTRSWSRRDDAVHRPAVSARSVDGDYASGRIVTLTWTGRDAHERRPRRRQRRPALANVAIFVLRQTRAASRGGVPPETYLRSVCGAETRAARAAPSNEVDGCGQRRTAASIACPGGARDHRLAPIVRHKAERQRRCTRAGRAALPRRPRSTRRRRRSCRRRRTP